MPSEKQLLAAIQAGNEDAVCRILELEASSATLSSDKSKGRDEPLSVAFDDDQAIRLASAEGYDAIVRMLLEYDCNVPRNHADPSALNNEALRSACGLGHVEVVQVLLDSNRVHPAAEDNEALCNAARCGYISIVNMLLDYGDEVDPTARNNYPIRWASRNGHLEVVKRLLSLEASIGIDVLDSMGMAIWDSISNGHVDILRELLQHPSSQRLCDGSILDDPNVTMWMINSQVALFNACRRGDHNVVKIAWENMNLWKEQLVVVKQALQLASRKQQHQVTRFLLYQPQVLWNFNEQPYEFLDAVHMNQFYVFLFCLKFRTKVLTASPSVGDLLESSDDKSVSLMTGAEEQVLPTTYRTSAVSDCADGTTVMGFQPLPYVPRDVLRIILCFYRLV